MELKIESFTTDLKNMAFDVTVSVNAHRRVSHIVRVAQFFTREEYALCDKPSPDKIEPAVLSVLRHDIKYLLATAPLVNIRD